MQFFKITAEQVYGFNQLLKDITGEKIEVMLSGRDPTFDSLYVIVVYCDKQTAEKVRDMVWECNYGAYCDLQEITGDELDDMC